MFHMLVCIVLSTPMSSAEAQSGFFTLKYIRNSHRSWLTPENLNYDAAAKYTKIWINKGQFPSDYRRGKDKEDFSKKSSKKTIFFQQHKRHLKKQQQR